MGSTYVGYDPLRVITLRDVLADAIGGLHTIASSDPAAAGAIASVRHASLLLESEYLPAVDALRSSDALLRAAFGVGLTADGFARFQLHTAPTFLDRGTPTPTGLEQWTDDELLEHFSYLTLERDVATFDADSMGALANLYRELERRLASPDGGELATELSERVDDMRSRITGVADQLTNLAALGDDTSRRALTAMTGTIVALADHHDGLDAWLRDEAIGGSSGATQILLADPDHAADADLLLAVAATSFAFVDDAGSTMSMTAGEADTLTDVLHQIATDPDTAAALLADENTLTTMLRDGAGLDDDAVDAVFTAGLARPLLQRSGERKSLEQANEELIEGWVVWRRALDHSLPAFIQKLDVGAARGLANSMHVYLPTLSSGLISENRTGGERPAEQPVFALVGDEHVDVGTWGQIGMLLGHIASDDEGNATLRSTAYAFTQLQLQRGVESATLLHGRPGERNDEIGRLAAPAVELNHLLYVGIGLKEDTVQRNHADAQAKRKLMADMVVETAKQLAVKNPMIELATTPAQEWFDAQVDDWLTSAPPQLSHEVPLDYPSVFRAAFLDTIADADADTRLRLGLGTVTARRWADIRAATNDYWEAQDAEARRLANQRIEKLTNDGDEQGDVDEEGRAIARAYHDARTSSGLASWRPEVSD